MLVQGLQCKRKDVSGETGEGPDSVCLGIVAQPGEEPIFVQRDCRSRRNVISISQAGVKSVEMRRDPSPSGNVINSNSIIGPQTS